MSSSFHCSSHTFYYLSRLGDMDFKLKYLKVTDMPIEFPILNRITWSLCFFSWGCSISIILAQFYLQPDFQLVQTFAYYHILAMLNGFCSLWFINCTAFGIASQALSSQVKVCLLSYKPAKKLQKLRVLWDDLSSMMQPLLMVKISFDCTSNAIPTSSFNLQVL
jgi:gustatory receptor